MRDGRSAKVDPLHRTDRQLGLRLRGVRRRTRKRTRHSHRLSPLPHDERPELGPGMDLAREDGEAIRKGDEWTLCL
jgi:hypothetical protein